MAYLNLKTKNVLLIRPSKSTPQCILSLSTLDNIPEHDILCQTIHVYRSTIHDFDPAHVIKEALSKALVYYYPLAGRIVRHTDGKLRVKCTTEYGVPFLEAIANCNLSSLHYLDDTDTEIAKHLVLHLPSQDQSCYQFPLVFKVTKFLCGGFTTGMGVSHAIVDGIGASQFFRAIVEISSGRSEPSVKPVWERERLVGSITKQPLESPMDIASAAVSPFLPTTDIVHDCFKVEREIITRLKLSLMKEEESFTTFESLAAYVWRSRARALKLSYNGKTMLNVIVGARQHLDSPLPEGYYGNAIVDANVVLTVKELNERPLSEIVKLIRETKKVAFTADYIRNSINTFETKQEDCNLEGTGAVTVLTEWKHLGFLEKVDFGGSEAVNIVPAPCNMFGSVGMCIFSSPYKFEGPSMKGGVRIFTSLPIAAVPKFREEMEALRLIK